MNLRVAKKILKNQENLKYKSKQVKKAEIVVNKAIRNANKIKEA